MGSPNFYTAHIEKVPFNVGLTSDVVQTYGNSLDNSELNAAFISDVFDDLKYDINDCEKPLFGEIVLKSGYHDGFQLYYKVDDSADFDDLVDYYDPPNDIYHCPSSAEDFIRNCRESIILYDSESNELSVDDDPEIAQLGDFDFTLDDDGTVKSFIFTVNEDKVRAFIEQNQEKVLDNLAQIALCYDLRPVIGLSWTSGLQMDEKASQRELESFLIDSEQPSGQLRPRP